MADSITDSKAAKNSIQWLPVLHGGMHCLMAGLIVCFIAMPELAGLFCVSFLICAVVACMVGLNRQMPFQNILMGAGTAALIGSLAHALSAIHSWAIPFGPIYFHERCGTQFMDLVPWSIPILWMAAILGSRGTARVILRPWRKLKTYGYWQLGVTSLLAMVLDLAIEPYATTSQHLWSWQATKIPLNWYGASPLNFICWALVALLIQAFATPAMVKKRPGSRSPLDLLPVTAWLGMVILCAAGCAKSGLWPSVVADGVIILTTVGLVIPGARW